MRRLENPPHMSLASSEVEMTFDRGLACLSESFYADTQGYLTISFMYYMKEIFTAEKQGSTRAGLKRRETVGAHADGHG